MLVFLPFSTPMSSSQISHTLSYRQASGQACPLSVDSHTLAQHPEAPPTSNSWLLGLSAHISTLLSFTWLHVFSSKALLYEERLFYNFFLQTSNLTNPLFVKLTYTYKKEMEITCHWELKLAWNFPSKPAQNQCVVSSVKGHHVSSVLYPDHVLILGHCTHRQLHLDISLEFIAISKSCSLQKHTQHTETLPAERLHPHSDYFYTEAKLLSFPSWPHELEFPGLWATI